MHFDAGSFIRANTQLMAPAHVPELSLHLASEISPLWHKTEEELGQIGLPPPFWAFAWAGGQGLARYILDNPQTVYGKEIVDFAAGSGIVGIAAALAGAASVTCIDTDKVSATAVSLNAAANGVSLQFSSADPIGKLLDTEVLLAGDVFYDRELARRLLPWMKDLQQSGTEILVGDPGRAYLPHDNLVRLATYTIPCCRELEDSEIKNCSVWRFHNTRQKIGSRQGFQGRT